MGIEDNNLDVIERAAKCVIKCAKKSAVNVRKQRDLEKSFNRIALEVVPYLT
jgi:hypothetical protein